MSKTLTPDQRAEQLRQERQELLDKLSKWVMPKPCVICHKLIQGPYGRHVKNGMEIWTCSLIHEREYHASTAIKPPDAAPVADKGVL